MTWRHNNADRIDTKRNKTIIISGLPDLIKKDPDIRDYIIKITRVRYADKETTDERFDRIPDELKRDREERSKRLQEEGKRAFSDTLVVNHLVA